MKRYICDMCQSISWNEEDIPEYRMFVCDNFDGLICNLCVKCENKIKSHFKKLNCEHCKDTKKIWEDEDGRRVWNDCPECVKK